MDEGNYGQPMRKWLKEQHIEEYIDFGISKYFKEHNISCIIRIAKSALGQASSNSGQDIGLPEPERLRKGEPLQR